VKTPAATSDATTTAAPSARSSAYYLDWIGELSELHGRGMLTDEDFAAQRTERLEELMNKPRRRWLWWIRVAVPMAGLGGVAAWWETGDYIMIRVAALTVVLCVFAAASRLSRERCSHLTTQQRSDILYDLLGGGLISSEEFLVFDDCLTQGRKR
jgi:hypothetical protein